jgi:hypothetical protein
MQWLEIMFDRNMRAAAKTLENFGLNKHLRVQGEFSTLVRLSIFCFVREPLNTLSVGVSMALKIWKQLTELR